MKKPHLYLTLLFLAVTGDLSAQAPQLPQTPAAHMLQRFLDAVATGEIESFVDTAFQPQQFQRILRERHIRFLQMIHRRHGGFTVYSVVESDSNRIVAVCKSRLRNAWRRIVVGTDPQQPSRLAGLDFQDTPPPEEYLRTLPRIQIERPPTDDALVVGATAQSIDDYMTFLESVGYSGGVALAKDGKILLAKGYGYSDRHAKKVFNRQTVFTIGSITKQFTGAAIVKLKFAGKLAFTDSLSRFFDNVPADKQGITVHHLLTHTAGFPGAIGDDRERIGRDDFVRLALNTKLDFPPGSQYQYSNVGYSLLAAIIEKVTGLSYEAYLRRTLFLPAGMTQTGYMLPNWDPETIVIGYMGESIWGKPTDILWGPDGPGWHLKGNGGLLSTLNDMLRWGQAILGDQVFSPEEKRVYLEPYVPEGPDAESYYAYGWVRMKGPGGRDLITHNGGNPFIQNDMYIFPEEKLVLYLTSNNGEFSAIDQSPKILSLLFAGR